jgi:hypothetical protein
MRRALALVAVSGALLAAAACGSKSDTATPSAAPATSASVDVKANTAAACTAADAVYANLDATAKAEMVKGFTAAQKGDKAAVEKSLQTLLPIFTAAAASFSGEATKAANPEVKAALTTIGESFTKAAGFKSFNDFESLEATTTPAETSLKKLCTDAGVTLKNFE